MLDGAPYVVLEQVNRLADDVAPEWPHGNVGDALTSRVGITGRPTMRCAPVFDPPESEGGLTATAMRAVNGIPTVVSAPCRVSVIELAGSVTACAPSPLPTLHRSPQSVVSKLEKGRRRRVGEISVRSRRFFDQRSCSRCRWAAQSLRQPGEGPPDSAEALIPNREPDARFGPIFLLVCCGRPTPII